jgi:hypothetical protein
VAPASPVFNRGDILRAVAALESMGFQTKLGEHVRDRRGYLAGDDDSLEDIVDDLLRPLGVPTTYGPGARPRGAPGNVAGAQRGKPSHVQSPIVEQVAIGGVGTHDLRLRIDHVERGDQQETRQKRTEGEAVALAARHRGQEPRASL